MDKELLRASADNSRCPRTPTQIAIKMRNHKYNASRSARSERTFLRIKKNMKMITRSTHIDCSRTPIKQEHQKSVTLSQRMKNLCLNSTHQWRSSTPTSPRRFSKTINTKIVRTSKVLHLTLKIHSLQARRPIWSNWTQRLRRSIIPAKFQLIIILPFEHKVFRHTNIKPQLISRFLKTCSSKHHSTLTIWTSLATNLIKLTISRATSKSYIKT